MRALITGSLIVMAAGLLTGCATTPPEEDPVQIKLNDIDARLTRAERIVSNQSLVELQQQLEQAQASIRQLRGRIDQLENSSETTRKQQKDLYNDLDKRLSALQGGGAGAGPAGGAFGGPSGGNAGGAAGAGATTSSASGGQGSAGGSSVEQAVYNQAFDALKAGSYSVAITGFKDFLTTYPQSPLAENAQYWLGEAYYVTRDFDNAQTAFRTVLDKWPDSRKASDAMLKLGYTQYELKRYGDARRTLTEVAQKFPNSDAAKLANDRLAHIPANSR
jgi:tol-pal system protein YbgF